MLSAIKDRLKSSRIYSFNLVNRDAWIAEMAHMVPGGARVLDVGAGSCPYRDLFAHCDYRTQDFAGLQDEQLRHGSYGQVDYICDATEIPVADGSFDVILCTEVIEHVPEPVAVVKEFARILKPGGRLILTAPLGSGIHQEPYHFYGGYTPYWYEKFLDEAGFRDISVKANAGSFKAFSQESIRFVQMTRPHAMKAPMLMRLLWAPLWLLLLMVLAGLVPIMCHVLDRFDREQRFTIGYHVTAKRA